MESKELLSSIQKMIISVITPISRDFIILTHIPLCQSILNHIISQKQNYISKIQIQNLDVKYTIKSVDLIDPVQPGSYFFKNVNTTFNKTIFESSSKQSTYL